MKLNLVKAKVFEAAGAGAGPATEIALNTFLSAGDQRTYIASVPLLGAPGTYAILILYTE